MQVKNKIRIRRKDVVEIKKIIYIYILLNTNFCFTPLLKKIKAFLNNKKNSFYFDKDGKYMH